MKDHKIIIATGGTGGHLFPAKQLAKQLNEKNIQTFFAGSKGQFFNDKNEEFFFISTSTVRKKNLPIAVLKIFYGVIQSVKLIRKLKPNLIIGFGSFHCFPILFASKILKIPYVLYEPNTVCGMVNRLFSKSALALAVQFEKTKMHKCKNIITTSFLPWKKIEKTPKEIVRSKLNLKKDQFTLMVFGGSQGALFLNELIFKVIEEVKDRRLQLIHVTGNEKTTKLAKLKYEKLNVFSHVASFVEDIPFFCLGADLVICRSGAATIGDLIQTSTPSMLIPYPFATDDHQHENAKILQDSVKGACLHLQEDITVEKFIQAIDSFRHNNCSKLHVMRKNLKEFYEKESKSRVTLAEIIEGLCHGKNTMS